MQFWIAELSGRFELGTITSQKEVSNSTTVSPLIHSTDAHWARNFKALHPALHTLPLGQYIPSASKGKVTAISRSIAAILQQRHPDYSNAITPPVAMGLMCMTSILLLSIIPNFSCCSAVVEPTVHLIIKVFITTEREWKDTTTGLWLKHHSSNHCVTAARGKVKTSCNRSTMATFNR